MADLRVSDSATVLAEPPDTGEVDDEFTLDVRVVVSTRLSTKSDCATDDGCGPTCEDGASACDSFIDDPA
ncbi:FxLD family lanthipeptide [Streptomyces sp. NBC_01803]|uniref:FxLD family lanthipeptide n=1 Tax=Streptomyces sp. NBC_01803 TaxID=2975946 RepID=UPI002DD85938|nr:FxLD family lanthipeptide [Streptomyces sp. NBC_01803]WSA43697.1 FxLD family lanthipeptide [Streptomyces sp. NBC_01803]